MDVNGYQREYRALGEELRTFVMREVSWHGAGRVGSLEHRAIVTLYWLFQDHPIDPSGRCRSCRRPGSVFGTRWWRCDVYNKAFLCLKRLDEVSLLDLLSRAMRE